jgi:6-pyruvoyltetrahydropterin/6-carboxytetrahydropterin synthase
MVLLTRKVHFCASHRYHNPELSDAENKRIFGKCNLPHGHGHNYVLEVTVRGEVDPATGMVMNLTDLDKVVKNVVMEQIDHKNLNVDVPHFATTIPTSENIVIWLWGQLAEEIAEFATLQRLVLHEDPFLCVEYEGEKELSEEPVAR